MSDYHYLGLSTHFIVNHPTVKVSQLEELIRYFNLQDKEILCLYDEANFKIIAVTNLRIIVSDYSTPVSYHLSNIAAIGIIKNGWFTSDRIQITMKDNTVNYIDIHCVDSYAYICDYIKSKLNAQAINKSAIIAVSSKAVI